MYFDFLLSLWCISDVFLVINSNFLPLVIILCFPCLLPSLPFNKYVVGTPIIIWVCLSILNEEWDPIAFRCLNALGTTNMLRSVINFAVEPFQLTSSIERIPSTTPGEEPPRDAKDSGSARSHSTHLETSSSNRP